MPRERKTKPIPKILVTPPVEPDWPAIIRDLLQAGYRRKTISKMPGMDLHEHTLNKLRVGEKAKVPWMAGQILLELHSKL